MHRYHALAIVLTLVACGTDLAAPPAVDPPLLPDGGAPEASVPDAAALDAAALPKLDPPTGVTATVDRPDHVEVRWQAPDAGGSVSGYRITRDNITIGVVASRELFFVDRTAVQATLRAPNIGVGSGTNINGVPFSFSPLGSLDQPAAYDYAVVAVYADRESAPSRSARGSASGEITGYEFTRDDGVTWHPIVPPLAHSMLDEQAPRAPVSLPAPSATGDDIRSLVKLELATHATVTTPADGIYRVRVKSGAKSGPPSSGVPAHRGTAAPETLSIRWQRSAGPTDAAYSDLPAVTGRTWFDETIPVDQTRYYRARVEPSVWAEETVSGTASASVAGWADVAAGWDHTCAIRKIDGKVVCWGSNYRGQAPPGPSLDSFKSLSAGFTHTCGIRAADDRVVCWGLNDVGQAPPGPSATAFRAIAAGNGGTCGIRLADAKVECWGGDSSSGGLASGETVHPYRTISRWDRRTCGIASDDNNIYCWSRYTAGVEELDQAGPFDSLAIGYRTCAVRSGSGRVHCYGAGIGPEPAGAPFKSVVNHQNYNCAVRAADNSLVCWTFTGGNATPPGLGAIASATMYAGHGCALRVDGRIRCWGSSESGQAMPVPPSQSLKTVRLGRNAGCGVSATDDTAVCWGDNNRGQIDTGDRAPVVDVSVGYQHSCAIRKADNRVVCRGMPTSILTPPTDRFTALSSGFNLSCGIRDDERAQCWGQSETNHPFGAPSQQTFFSISGAGPLCGSRSPGGGLTCFGRESPPSGGSPSVGHDGILCTSNSVGLPSSCWATDNTPVPGVPTFPVKRVATGVGFACAVRGDNQHVSCWRTTAGSFVPADSIDAFSAIAANAAGVCGIRIPDKRLVCWGQAAASVPFL